MYGNVEVVVAHVDRMSPGRGPHRPRQASAPVTSRTVTEPSPGACCSIHDRSWRPNAVPGDDEEPLPVEPVTVTSHSMPPRRLSIDVYVTEPTGLSTRLAHSSLRGRRPRPARSPRSWRSSTRRTARPSMRVARCSVTIAVDQCSPAQPRGRKCSWAGILVAGVPVDPLPPALLAEHGAELAVARVRRRRAQRPTGRALVVGVGDVVVRAVDLVGAGQAVAPRLAYCGPNRRTSIFHRSIGGSRPTIHSAITLPDAAGAGDAVGAEPGGDEEPGDLALAEDELAVGRERLRPVDQLDDVGVDERRHDPLAGVGERREALPVGVEQTVVEVGRDAAVEAPRRRGRARSRRRSARRPPRGSRRDDPDRASSAACAGTVRCGRVMAYWWAIGTTGTSTPARRPISWLYIPPAIDDELALDAPAVGLARRSTRRRPARLDDVDPGDPACPWPPRRPPPWRRRRGPSSGPTG